MRRLSRLLPVAVAAVALASGCGGNGNGGDAEDATGSDSGALAVTLTDTECTYSGPESVAAGMVSTSVDNETDQPSRFELLRVAADAAPEDLVAYVEGERLVLTDGGALTWPPTFATVVVREPVRPRWNTSLAADLTPGAYGVVCFAGSPPTELYLATTLSAS
jgi:hypothetical protein